MAQFELVESCDVDDGSLDGLSAQLCFALGVEWMKFLSDVRRGSPFTASVHQANSVRLVQLAERHNRFVEHHEFSPGWTRITVGGHRD